MHVSHPDLCPSHLQCPFPYLFNSIPCSSSRARQESRCLVWGGRISAPRLERSLAPHSLMVILWFQVRILCACKFLIRLSASLRETSSQSSPGPGHIVITKYNECKGTKEPPPALVRQHRNSNRAGGYLPDEPGLGQCSAPRTPGPFHSLLNSTVFILPFRSGPQFSCQKCVCPFLSTSQQGLPEASVGLCSARSSLGGRGRGPPLQHGVGVERVPSASLPSICLS